MKYSPPPHLQGVTDSVADVETASGTQSAIDSVTDSLTDSVTQSVLGLAPDATMHSGTECDTAFDIRLKRFIGDRTIRRKEREGSHQMSL